MMMSLEKRLSELPACPGVYLMKNSQGKIIYVGKAKLLNKRVRSYFDGREHEGHRAASLMRPHVRDIEWIITETEEEALILEANLIRKHKPVYNVRQKDDKHYPYITLTVKEPFPRAFITRAVRKDGNLYFGPFTNSRAVNHLLDLSTQLFHLRECKLKLPLGIPARPCLNYHIGRCDAPCAGFFTEEAYRQKVAEAIRLFEGKRDDLIRKWEAEMEEASLRFDFETAAKKRDGIIALQAADSKQKADVANAHFSLDVISIRRSEKLAAAAILEYRDGIFFGRRHYHLECNLEQNESEILQEMLVSWYWDIPLIPAEIALETIIPQKEQALIEKTLSEKAGRKITLVYPKRGEKLGFLRLAHANAEMLLVEMLAENRKYDEIEKSIFELQKELHLKKTPFAIECVDISHLSGTNTVASLVAFKNGRPDKSGYRKFLIKTVQGVDDFASMQEVLSRRIRRLTEESKPLPDLFVVDGGKGQVEAVQKIFDSLGQKSIPLIGLAKRLEEIVFPGNRASIVLRRSSPALKLLQNIRDEAHRFAITYQRSKRKKDLEVEWLNHPGIGNALRLKILSLYRTPEHFLNASPEDTEELLGKNRSKKIREQIAAYLNSKKR